MGPVLMEFRPGGTDHWLESIDEDGHVIVGFIHIPTLIFGHDSTNTEFELRFSFMLME